MRYFIALLGLLTIAATLPAVAQEHTRLRIDVAQNHVDITAGFVGADLTVFGTREGRGEVAVVLIGPQRRMIVREKKPVGGAWINADSMSFRKVPFYYDYAASQTDPPPGDPALRQDIGLNIDTMVFAVNDETDADRIARFTQALVETRKQRGLFPDKLKTVRFSGKNFFRTDFHLPANVPVGPYHIRAFLIEGNRLVETQELELNIVHVGASAAVFGFSHQHEILYGLLCVVLAVTAGWISNRVGRTV